MLSDLFMTVITFVIYVLFFVPELLSGIFFYCIRRIRSDIREDEKWLIVMGCGYIIPDQINARLDKAAALWKEHEELRIFLSGSEREGYSEPVYMARYLIKKGIPLSALYKDANGFTTKATMQNAASKNIKKQLSYQVIIIFTDVFTRRRKQELMLLQ